MTKLTVFIMATFTSPENIGTDPKSMLWLFPLTTAVAIVYKATKLQTITWKNFIKEVITLLGSIVVFLIITALVLYVFAWFTTE
jgi:hypothetical protein